MKNRSGWGWLKNGNQPGDFMSAPRCGAKTRRGTPCKCPAMRNRRRCRLRGGKSMGPKTAEGIERIRRAVTKYGRYTKSAQESTRRVRGALREALRNMQVIYRHPPRV
jgi:hypothetical protein